MSKFVKSMLIQDYARRLDGVNEAFVANVIGMDSDQSFKIRKHLRERNVNLLVVKNSLARKAMEGTPLEGALNGLEGSSAILWGSEDVVSLAKEIVKLVKSGDFPKFETRGGVIDGEQIPAEQIQDVSKWPTRGEQLSILVGQILAPGANLAAAMLGPGRKLASQIKSKSEEEGDAAEEAAA